MFKKTLISLSVMPRFYEDCGYLDTRLSLDKSNLIDFSDVKNFDLINSDLDNYTSNFIDITRFNYTGFKNRNTKI
jgi:hypothetical protein